MRTWVSLATFLLIILVLFFSRHELVRAWQLVQTMNVWILVLFVPLILASYFASGEMLFSFLRQKGLMKDVGIFTQLRMSLEMNFVNHALPSGGISGVSYMTWRLGKMGVSASKATTGQLVRLVAGFGSFFVLLALSVIAITIDGDVNRWIILVSSALVSTMSAAVIACIYFVQSQQRTVLAAKLVTKWVNRAVRFITRNKKTALLDGQKVENFFQEVHQDYLDIKREKQRLWQPFLWGIVFVSIDVMMFVVAFWALGQFVNPAPVLLAYGLASIAGFVVATPGGSGAYEALMVGFLTASGVNQGIAIAGVLVSRVLILLVIIVVGYVFYQQSILKYGKSAPRT